MILEEERKLVIAYSLKAINDGMTNGTAGNISVYNREKKLIAISPTGVRYETMQPKDVSIIDLQGNVIEGLKPSSEWRMHLTFYKNRSDINAVFHGHTTFATILACLNKPLPAIDYMVAISGQTSVPCAKYATFGTEELADNAWSVGSIGNAVLLANHGILTYACNLERSYNIAVQIEYVSKIYVNCLQTNQSPIILKEEEMQKMLLKFKSYGQ